MLRQVSVPCGAERNSRFQTEWRYCGTGSATRATPCVNPVRGSKSLAGGRCHRPQGAHAQIIFDFLIFAKIKRTRNFNDLGSEKIKMASGGFRASAGRPRKPFKKDDLSDDAHPETQEPAGNLTPLEYMLSVMNNPAAHPERRDRMAVAAAPYVHGRADAQALGKKEKQQERAKEASRGRFAPRPTPSFTVQ